MSGYARAAHALGASVSGSDSSHGPYLRGLEEDGVLRAAIGHAASNIPAGEDVEVVYSSAVPASNPERAAARERGLAERPRAELLAELSALRRTIAVAGTHGKTTTASMIVHALRAAGAEPGWLVGGTVADGLPNAEWGTGSWLVVEADESDRSMLSLHVEIAVLTNVEMDHHASFASLGELREVFREFLHRAAFAAVVWDRPELLALAGGPYGERRQGEGDEATGPRLVPYDVPAPDLDREGSSFDWHGRRVRLAVPGAHNALNAAGALEAVSLTGVPDEVAIESLAHFHGAGRRFQLLGRSAGGAEIYDDYAHHPTEVAATLAAARTLEHGRLVAVFQPHLYSRTALLAGDFGRELSRADVVVVLELYPARERAEEHPGVSALAVAEAAADRAGGRPVYWLPTFAEARPVLDGLLTGGDVCLLMGAGDVDTLARSLVAG
jgi:UDP-N-acetylmuramate--alanine ligase